MSIKLKGSSDGSVSFDAPADTSPSGSDITLTLPTSAGSANQFLKNSGIAGELEYSSMVETSTGIGIGGVTSPFDKLQVRTATDCNFVLSSAGGTEASFEIFNNAGSSNTPLNYRASEHKFKIQANEKMRLDTSGRLLVGTTSSYGIADKVQIVSDTGVNLHRGSSNTGAARLDLSKSRNTSYGSNTIVQSGDTLGSIVFRGDDGTDYTTPGGEIKVEVDGTPGNNDMPGRLVFSTTHDGAASTSNSMIINRNGELRIGYGSSDPVSTDQAHSYGDPNLDSVTTNLARLVMQERSGNWISFKDGSGTHYGTISRNPPGVSYGSNSDYRLKENVENFTNGITLVKQLRPVTFNWNESSGFDTTLTQRGFLAHEVQDVEPNAVVGDKDEMDRYGDCYDAEGVKTQVNVFEHQAKEGETWTFQSEDIRHQQLDPAKLVPILTAALQEAIAKIETLETKVAALEAA